MPSSFAVNCANGSSGLHCLHSTGPTRDPNEVFYGRRVPLNHNCASLIIPPNPGPLAALGIRNKVFILSPVAAGVVRVEFTFSNFLTVALFSLVYYSHPER